MTQIPGGRTTTAPPRPLVSPQTKMQWVGGSGWAQGMAHLMRVRFLPEPEVRVIPSRGPGSSGGPPGAVGQGNVKGGRGDTSGKEGTLEAGEKVGGGLFGAIL